MSEPSEKPIRKDPLRRFWNHVFNGQPDSGAAKFAIIVIGVFVGAVLVMSLFGIFVVAAKTLVGALELSATGPSAAGALSNYALIFGGFGASVVALWRLIIAQNSHDLDVQRDMTARFIKSVELLGATKSDGKPALEQRLGAIYALERLSKESEDHHIQIMEVLCAYIRTNSPADDTRWPGAVLREVERDLSERLSLRLDKLDAHILADDRFRLAIKESGLTLDRLREGRNVAGHDPALGEWISQQELPRADIQAALDVIGRRDDKRIALEQAQTPAYRLDLRHSKLRRADCKGKKLNHALISGSQLEAAEFNAADLEMAEFRATLMEKTNMENARAEMADFSSSQLDNADFDGAFLAGANFRNSQINSTRFHNADLETASFSSSQFRGAKFYGAHMWGANFYGANILDTEFVNAKMELVGFQDAQIKLVKFYNSKMHKSIFNYSKLENVEFIHANMSMASFDYSYLSGTPEVTHVFKSSIFLAAVNKGGALRFVDLSQSEFDSTTDFRNAFGDGSVLLPETIERPLHWSKEVLDDVAFFGHWRGWIECGPRSDLWRTIAPEGYKDVSPIPPPEGCEWVKRAPES